MNNYDEKMKIGSHTLRIVGWALGVIVLIVIATFIFNSTDVFKKDGDPVQQASELDIKTFSLGGEVTAINSDSLTVRTGWVQKGEFVYYDRTIKFTDKTEVLAVMKTQILPVLNQNPLDYFQVGDKITVYGDGNPYIVDLITATKVEVNR